MYKIIVQACLIMTIILSQSVRADDPVPSIQTKVCTPTEVAVLFNSRLHIKCSTPMRTGYYSDINIYFFSVSTNDYDNLNYARELATSAITAGHRLKLYARSSANYNPSGCGTNNCRKLTGITLLD